MARARQNKLSAATVGFYRNCNNTLHPVPWESAISNGEYLFNVDDAAIPVHLVRNGVKNMDRIRFFFVSGDATTELLRPMWA